VDEVVAKADPKRGECWLEYDGVVAIFNALKARGLAIGEPNDEVKEWLRQSDAKVSWPTSKLDDNDDEYDDEHECVINSADPCDNCRKLAAEGTDEAT
jgi:hypothetical protein